MFLCSLLICTGLRVNSRDQQPPQYKLQRQNNLRMVLPAPNQKRQMDPAAGSWEAAPKSARYTDRCVFQFTSVLRAGLSLGRHSLCNKVERAVAMKVGRKPHEEVKTGSQ